MKRWRGIIAWGRENEAMDRVLQRNPAQILERAYVHLALRSNQVEKIEDFAVVCPPGDDADALRLLAKAGQTL